MSNNTLGDKIRAIRKGLKLNQYDFAIKLGFKSATAVSKFEDNSREPSKNCLIEIANMGNITLDELVTGKKYDDERDNNSFEKESLAPYEASESLMNKEKQFRISDALTMCTRVLESGTSYATALYFNIEHFDRAIKTESFANKCREDLRAVNETIKKMHDRMDSLEKENKTLHSEIQKLKGSGGGSAPTELSPDNAALTGTENKET